MTQYEFAQIIINLPAESRENFFKTLKATLAEEEYKTLVMFIGSYELLQNSEKYEAIKDAISEMIYEEFTA